MAFKQGQDPAKQLLNLAIAAGDETTVTPQEELPQRTEEDQRFLSEAYKQFVAQHKSPTDELLEVMAGLKQLDADNEDLPALLEVVSEMCENIDVAGDLFKSGNFPVIEKLLGSENRAEVRANSAWVLGSCAQNNPFCQEKLLEAKMLPVFIEMIADADTAVAAKALFALSCLIRENEKCLKKFIVVNGFDALASHCLGSEQTKLHMKAVFLMRALCASQSSCHMYLSKASVVNQLCELLCVTVADESLIDQLLQLILMLATRAKNVVELLAVGLPVDVLQRCKNNCEKMDWPLVHRNADFLLHLISKKSANDNSEVDR